jgi:hypothetical protein
LWVEIGRAGRREEARVSIVGRWEVAIKTPMGEPIVVLEFRDESDGVARYGTDSIQLTDVFVSADTATWRVSLAQPMKVTLTCGVQIDGDTMTGSAGAGLFGTFPLRGRRTPA